MNPTEFMQETAILDLINGMAGELEWLSDQLQRRGLLDTEGAPA